MLVQIDNQAQSQIKTNSYDLFPAILKMKKRGGDPGQSRPDAHEQ